MVEAPKRFLRADARGRWITLLTPGGPGFLRRTLDGRVVRRAGDGAVDLEPGEAADAHRRAAALAADFAVELEAASPEALHLGGTGDKGALLRMLAAVRAWSPARHEEERARYARAYPEAVPVLPPDRYADLVVLPAVGCANRGCTFCTLHRDRPFRAATADEFAAHLEAVAELLGPLAPLRDGLFLGSASALSLPNRRLRAVFEQVEATLGGRRRGIASFFDPDHAPRRGVADWRELTEAGVVRAVLGLETGLPELRARLHKSDDVGHVVRVTREMAEGGVGRGVTVLVGAGGPAAAEAHRAATVEVLAEMELGRGDLVYLSPLAGSLPAPTVDEETARLKGEIRARIEARVVPYRLDRFRHYA